MTTAALTRTNDRADTHIAHAAARALDIGGAVPATVQVHVHNGYITLTGSVPWVSQKALAEGAVFSLHGVRGVKNHITVRPESLARDVYCRIVETLRRRADGDARHIGVAVDADVATLTGSVGSWPQRKAAERAATQAPGIKVVDNRIAVEPIDRPEPLDARG
jgi:osmotically-inducible protein OsmY